MVDREDPRKSKVIKLLAGAGPKRVTRPRPKSGVSVNGDSNVVGDGNTVNNFINQPPPRHLVMVKTGDGVLTAEQKAKINKAFDEWMSARSIVRRTDPAVGALRKSFNAYMKVNSYHEILLEDFDKAMSWIRRHMGIVMSMKSAAAKVPEWRKKRYKAINARAKEFPAGVERMRAYMDKTFGKLSQRDLSDAELDRLYRHVMGWRK